MTPEIKQALTHLRESGYGADADAMENRMTTKPETVADVLADIRRSVGLGTSCMRSILPSELDVFCARIESAIAAGAEPVAWAPGLECTVDGFISCKAFRDGEFTTPLYTLAKPAAQVEAPASVPDGSLFDDALAEAFSRYPEAQNGLTFFACAIQGPRAPTEAEIEWAKSQTTTPEPTP